MARQLPQERGPSTHADLTPAVCLPTDDNLGVCWQEVGPDLVCSRPRLDRQATYTECCCLYGEAWGMDCAFCPAQDSGALLPSPHTIPSLSLPPGMG